MKLSSVPQKFVLHWGEMGTRWGINRTVAQIHALLYLSEKPLHAEEIAETLAIARSNVSNSLKELQGWRIVRVVHVLGDRRDHFESTRDVWEMFQTIMDERKKREIDPTMQLLDECLKEAKAAGDAATEKKMEDMRSFFTTMSNWYTQIRRWPTGSIIKFMKLGDRVKKFLSAA